MPDDDGDSGLAAGSRRVSVIPDAGGCGGRIVEICAEAGQFVEHGQVLMRIDPR